MSSCVIAPEELQGTTLVVVGSGGRERLTMSMEGRGIFKIMLTGSLNRVGRVRLGRGMATRGHRGQKTASADVTKASITETSAVSIHFSLTYSSDVRGMWPIGQRVPQGSLKFPQAWLPC